jgi:hypothetical protein
MVMLIISVEGHDVVAQEPRRRCPSVGDQGLIRGERQLERVSQER